SPPPGEPQGPGRGAGSGELEGTWKVMSCEAGAQAVDLACVYEKVVIQDGKYLAYRGDEAVAFFVLECDGSKHPRQVELTSPPEPEPFLGIYAREGDALKVCWDSNRPGKWPTAFTGAYPCMCLVLIEYESFKAEAARLQGNWAVLWMEENGARVPEGTGLTEV